MISGRLTMRAVIERNIATGKDSWGNPVAPEFAPLGDPLPCFIWSKASREIVDGAKTAMVEDVRGLFAIDADIREGDVIASVTDRRGRVTVQGRLKVDGPVQRKHTHQEAALERIS